MTGAALKQNQTQKKDEVQHEHQAISSGYKHTYKEEPYKLQSLHDKKHDMRSRQVSRRQDCRMRSRQVSRRQDCRMISQQNCRRQDRRMISRQHCRRLVCRMRSRQGCRRQDFCKRSGRTAASKVGGTATSEKQPKERPPPPQTQPYILIQWNWWFNQCRPWQHWETASRPQEVDKDIYWCYPKEYPKPTPSSNSERLYMGWKTINTFLLSLKLMQSEADANLFFRHDTGDGDKGYAIHILLYLDNMQNVYPRTTVTAAADVKAKLMKQYKPQTSAPPDSFLG